MKGVSGDGSKVQQHLRDEDTEDSRIHKCIAKDDFTSTKRFCITRERRKMWHACRDRSGRRKR